MKSVKAMKTAGKSIRDEQKKRVIAVLNDARARELHVIHQYMNQHYSLANQDYGELAAKLKLVAIDEMRHAEAFAERIKELGGEPVTEPTAKTTTGQKVEVVYGFDADLEDEAIVLYNQFQKVCQENGDLLSAKLFERITTEEQAHFNYFDNVKDHIKSLGAAYLARIAGTPAEVAAVSPGFAGGTAQGTGGAA